MVQSWEISASDQSLAIESRTGRKKKYADITVNPVKNDHVTARVSLASISVAERRTFGDRRISPTMQAPTIRPHSEGSPKSNSSGNVAPCCKRRTLFDDVGGDSSPAGKLDRIEARACCCTHRPRIHRGSRPLEPRRGCRVSRFFLSSGARFRETPLTRGPSDATEVLLVVADRFHARRLRRQLGACRAGPRAGGARGRRCSIR